MSPCLHLSTCSSSPSSSRPTRRLAGPSTFPIPSTRVALEEDKARSLMKLIALIEDNDDVQNVYGNHEIDDATMEKISA